MVSYVIDNQVILNDRYSFYPAIYHHFPSKTMKFALSIMRFRSKSYRKSCKS